ncbi:hypothetical protein J7E28_05655 [Microbacterium sp. ISL-108]|nr:MULTISPECIES: hypothetical protein [unclassified Microbacterium]MBT2484182.1 hypothetical protein [Microbacterium sp. ISL-108]
MLAIAIFVGMPSNVLSLRDGSALRLVFRGFMPQGWAFFTKPPNDPEFHVYAVVDDEAIASAMLFPNARVENLFGSGEASERKDPSLRAWG